MSKQPGSHNAITDVPGLRVGHHTQGATGTTVLLTPPQGAVCGVDVRGSAPATRETDLLDPCNLIERVHAVVLTGGSVFGLAAVDGVVRYLETQGVGFPVAEGHVVPIVPAAALYDLGSGGNWSMRPDADFGRQACLDATNGAVAQGNVGAGAGAVVARMTGGLKGGIGTASLQLSEDMVVGALVAVNAFGSPVDPKNGKLHAAAFGLDGEFPSMEPKPLSDEDTQNAGQVLGHTTLGIIATNVSLSKPQATKLAQMTHDGLARAIHPIHTMFDGDTIFALSTAEVEFQAGEATPFGSEDAVKTTTLGAAAADVMARAVGHAMLNATSACDVPGYREQLR